MPEYMLGVDGGGTKTHYALVDRSGKVVSFLTGGPMNHEVVPGGFREVKEEFAQSLALLLKKGEATRENIAAATFGLAGVDVRTQKLELVRIITAEGIKDPDVFNDAFLGIRAGCSKGYGICSIHGTGTCCAGLDRHGNRLQIGGVSYVSGSEGGADYLGARVIGKVYDYLFRDGLAAPVLKGLLFRMLELEEPQELVEVLYEKIPSGRVHMADIARFAFIAASEQEEAAMDILRQSGRELAASVLGAIRNLDFREEERIDIVLAGSIHLKGENPLLIHTFQSEIRNKVGERAVFTLLKEPPVTGAVLWAMERAGCVLNTDLMEKVKRNVYDASLQQ